jgi:GntR family transcriptional regulator
LQGGFEGGAHGRAYVPVDAVHSLHLVAHPFGLQDLGNAVLIHPRLQAEGLVSTEFGRGTFVRSRPPLRRVSAAQRHAEHRSSGKPIFDTEAIAQGQVSSRQMLEIGRVAAPADAAKWLEIKPGESVVIRKRLQLLDGEPAVISTSYYPLWVAADTRLESPDALPEGPDVLI